MDGLNPISFAISSASGYSKKSNDSELINMFVHLEESGAKTNHILINTEGLKTIKSFEDDIHGIYEFKESVFVVTSSKLYEIKNGSDEYNVVGSVSFDSKVSFSDNGIDIMMVSDNGYAYTPSTSTMKDMSIEAGWYPSDTVAYMDGYFIFNRSGTGQFFISKLYSTELDPIDWATGESAPDDTVAVIVSNRQLWLMGERTCEIWYDSGDPDFPFTRIGGGVTDIGITNHNTLAKLRDNIFFVGSDLKVYMTQGYAPTIVSTPAIERHLFKGDIESYTAFSYNNEGHWFYVLTIDEEHTFVYDRDTAQWHRRMSCGVNKWRVEGIENISNTSKIFGYGKKDIYELSIDILTENEEPIRREAISLPVNQGVNRFRFSECQLDMEVGFDTDAEVVLQFSNDAGTTWSNKYVAHTGKIGHNRHRVRWLRLGQFRDCILKIVITDPIPIRILGLFGRFT